MNFTRAAWLPCIALLITMPAVVRCEEPTAPESLTTREFHMEHVDVKEANAIVRSILSVRKSAVDQRRQVIILSDTPDRLDQAAKILAQVDAALPEWSVKLVARSGSKEVVLRTASISQGHLEVRFGPPPVTTRDNLGVTAAVTRATSGEIGLEWSAALAMAGAWTESAHAVETLHDQATVTLVKTEDPVRQKALGSLIGAPGWVDALVLEISKAGTGASVKDGQGR